MRRFLAVLPFLALAACQIKPVYLNRDTRRVVVLPPFNMSLDLSAPEKAWPHVQNKVAAHGYAVVPQSEVQAFYQSKKFTQPEEIKSFSATQICEALKADGVVYSNITYWGKKTLLVSTYVGVEMEFEFVDKSGDTLWSGKGEHGKSSGGLTGRDIAEANAEMLLLSPANFVGGAVNEGLARLPLAGYEPKGK
jgi:hypothetical protein